MLLVQPFRQKYDMYSAYEHLNKNDNFFKYDNRQENKLNNSMNMKMNIKIIT